MFCGLYIGRRAVLHSQYPIWSSWRAKYRPLFQNRHERFRAQDHMVPKSLFLWGLKHNQPLFCCSNPISDSTFPTSSLGKACPVILQALFLHIQCWLWVFVLHYSHFFKQIVCLHNVMFAIRAGSIRLWSLVHKLDIILNSLLCQSVALFLLGLLYLLQSLYSLSQRPP